MRDILTIVNKELLELRHSAKHLIWFLAWLGLPVLLTQGNPNSSLLAMNYLYLILPALTAMATSGQIVLDSILGEKKEKTLELLLSFNIPTVTILIGKIIPAILAGYLFSQATVILLFVFRTQFTPVISLSNSFYLFFLPLFISYIASCFSAVTTILIPDQRVAPLVSILMMTTPLILLGRFGDYTLTGNSIVFALVIVSIICGLLTWFAALIFKKFPLITKV